MREKVIETYEKWIAVKNIVVRAIFYPILSRPTKLRSRDVHLGSGYMIQLAQGVEQQWQCYGKIRDGSNVFPVLHSVVARYLLGSLRMNDHEEMVVHQ
jgi:hypothetical protein